MSAQLANPRRWDTLIRLIGWGTVAGLLALPAIAMRFTAEVNWSAADFAAAAILLGSAGLACEIALRLSDSWTFRFAAVFAIGGAFLLAWINLAVGLVGSEANPANLVFFAVIAVIVGGAAIVRLNARGMTGVMALAALAQIGAGLVATILSPPGYREGFDTLTQQILLTGGFTVIFAGSAVLFARAARQFR